MKGWKTALGFCYCKIKDHKETSQTGNFKLEGTFSSMELSYMGVSKNIPFLHNIFCVTYLIWKSTRLQITFDLVEYIINE